MVINHGVCVGSWDRFATYVVPRAVGPIIALSEQTSITAAYNSILVTAPEGVLILQHDDLEITDPSMADKLNAAIEPDVAIVGVAGARGVTSLAWWNFDTVGHQYTDGRLIDFGPRKGDVDALEGSFLAFTPWAVKYLRFDPMPGFHGYDVSICQKARRKGMRVVVADIDTHHHTKVGVFKTAESQSQWYLADKQFQAEQVGDGSTP